MMHQQQVSCSGSYVIEHAVGEWRQRLPLAFVLQDILSRCCNTDDVMRLFEIITVTHVYRYSVIISEPMHVLPCMNSLLSNQKHRNFLGRTTSCYGLMTMTLYCTDPGVEREEMGWAQSHCEIAARRLAQRGLLSPFPQELYSGLTKL